MIAKLLEYLFVKRILFIKCLTHFSKGFYTSAYNSLKNNIKTKITILGTEKVV